jgi:hypothetical protein
MTKVPFLFLSIIAVVFILLSGCVSSQEKEILGEAGWESKDTEPAYRSLEDAIGAVGALDDIEAVVPQKEFYYIKGTGIQIDATAREWILGMKQGNETFFYVVNKWGGTKVPWPQQFPHEEIPIYYIKYPEELFKERPLLIQDLTDGGTREIDEIELIDETYILATETDRGFFEYRFNAYTGIET